MGTGLEAYTQEPWLSRTAARVARRARRRAAIATCCGRCSDPFGADGGLKLLRGNLGRAVIKTSAVQPQHRVVEAPARGVRRSGRGHRGVQGRRARARLRRRRALSGAARQRHAGAASAHADAQLAAEQRLQGRAGHRRTHVRRFRRRAGRDSRHAGMSRRRAAREECRTATSSGSTATRERWKCSVPETTLRSRPAPRPSLRAQRARRRPRAVRHVPRTSPAMPKRVRSHCSVSR